MPPPGDTMPPEDDTSRTRQRVIAASYAGTRMAGARPMTNTIDPDDLTAVQGGMNLDGARMSDNIEDRRGMTLEESLAVKSPPAPPLPPLIRHPGDLSSQLGLDDIGKFH